MRHKLGKFWKLIFGRTTIFIILMLAQALVFLAGFAFLNSKILWMNYIAAILAVIVLMYILNDRMDSDFKLMWIILILAVPVVGVFFYIYTKLQPGTHYIRNKIQDIDLEQSEYRQQDINVLKKIKKEAPREVGLFNYLNNQSLFPVYDKASARYFPIGEDMFDELIAQLEKAEEFIFIEFFIVDRGVMLDKVLEVLFRKVREGVEVRFMYDGTNALTNLPSGYPKYLRANGIDCKVFSPMRPVFTTHQNNRDHRKIVVVDGRCAFTGGINIADEYINKVERYGHWKDTGIMLEGDAVNSMTLLFLQLWNIDMRETEDFSKYLRYGMLPEIGMRNGGYVVPYGDSPMDTVLTGETVYLDIINRSSEYVHVMTPYLILDEELLDSLTYAAHRGVDVKLILPHIPDKKYAYLLARTYYPELIKEGVKIYEYLPGFVHAKVFTSDKTKAVVGSINLDFRSLYLHFECAAYFWKNPVVYDIEEDFDTTLQQCREITYEESINISVIKKIAGRLLRLIAPLM